MLQKPFQGKFPIFREWVASRLLYQRRIQIMANESEKHDSEKPKLFLGHITDLYKQKIESELEMIILHF
jgi:hypothetical protein